MNTGHIIKRDAIFNVKGTWYPRTVYQRKRSNTFYVVHRGHRFTVNYSQYGDTFTWAAWCDDSAKLSQFHHYAIRK
jgi:hypothetical protein